jgi:DNA-binding FadR family transcriptional regulator
VKAGSSYLSQNDLRAHFGLGAAAVAERIEVRWPSGRMEAIANVAANQIVTIAEGAGIVVRQPFSSPSTLK